MNNLSETVEVTVRFSEVDAMQIVWHGSYLHYLEDAREAFCLKWGFGYHRIYKLGFVAPVVDLKIRYLHSATFGEHLWTTVTLQPQRGAKLVFSYIIKNEIGDTVLTAQSTQLFTTIKGELIVSRPEFLDSLYSQI